VHVLGTDPTEFITPYSSLNVRAERFWEAAARIGKKSLMLNALSSGPARSDLVMQVGGGNSITPTKDPADTYLSGVSAQTYRINMDDEFTADSVKTRGGTWEAIDGKKYPFEKLGENVYVFPVVYVKETYDPNEVEKFTWTIIMESDGIRIGADEASAKSSPLVKPNCWSDVLTRRLMTNDNKTVPFHFRARLDSFDGEKGTASISITPDLNLYKEVTPISFAEELMQIDEIYNYDEFSLWEKPKSNINKYMEGFSYKLNWHRKVIAHTIENYDNDIIFDYIGNIDTINHRFRSAYEKVADNYEEDYDFACEAYLRAYKLIDDHILWLLENVVDENTTIGVISDHGSVGYNDSILPIGILENAGLLTCIDPNGNKSWRNINIDWSKTKAYPVGSCYFNVNLKGREPNGIVEPEDYEKVVNDIIRALQKQVETADDHISRLAFAVEKEQAGFIGHGGENCGDVVYGITGSKLGGYHGGVHSHQIPSARSKTGDIRSLCIMCGPKFKQNVTLTRPIDLTDFAPTLNFAVGYPQPKDATGGVIFQSFNDQ